MTNPLTFIEVISSVLGTALTAMSVFIGLRRNGRHREIS